MEPIEVLTFGLVIFAGVQVWLQVRSEAQRALERTADDQRRLDASSQFVWAEHFRLEKVCTRLEGEDLVLLASLGLLDENDVLPPDRDALFRHVQVIGYEAGYLGALAYVLTSEIRRDLSSLRRSVENANNFAPNRNPAQIQELVRAHLGNVDTEWIEPISKNLRELADLYHDVALHSSRSDIPRTFDFRPNMRSKMGRGASEEVAQRFGKNDGMGGTS